MGERGETLVLRKNAGLGLDADDELLNAKNQTTTTKLPVNGTTPAESEVVPHKNGKTPQRYDWNEISKHTKEGDSWLVLEDKVYDISKWALRHPGGKDVISSYAGQDGTEPFHAFHPDVEVVKKYLAPLYIGDLDKDTPALDERAKPRFNEALVADFRKLREDVRKMGLYDANLWFYGGMLAHILLLELVSYLIMLNYGTGWPVWLLCAVIVTTAQAQAGWLQHDFGHLSVFKDSKWNHWIHSLLICHLKSASRTWWNWRHFLHHAKPNTIFHDPDIRVSYVFVFGNEMARRWGLKRKGIMPYSIQHLYWHLVGPPLLLPVYFHYENIAYAINNRKWWDLFWMMTYFAKHFALYAPLLGFWGALWFYFFCRMLESHWFVYVSQMSHIPMHIDFDKKWDWPTLQNMTTCNVEQSWFNDWFTGHLNFQIEHHLFPTMPRHNYHKANVLVRELFKKHDVPLQTKTLSGAFADIVGSLKMSSDVWYEAYYGHARN